jgi:hypothetical protein
VALVGSSRSLFDVSSAELSREMGLEPEACANLGVRASSPLPGFEAITRDSGFNGLLVVEVFPSTVFGNSQHGRGQLVAEQVDPRFAYARVESDMLKAAAHNLAFLNGSARPLEGLAAVQLGIRGKWQFQQFGSLRGVAQSGTERWTPLDTSGASIESLETNEKYFARFEATMGKARTSAEFDELLDAFQHSAEECRARGGLVVFVFPPISGLVRDAVEKRFPRSAYWDRLAKRFGKCALHYSDFPETRNLQCPDGSHLNKEAALIYSRWLGQELKKLRDHATK